MIEEESNRLAPPFVHREGRIRLALSAIDRLESGPKTLVYFDLVDGEEPVLEVYLGSGIRRWVAAAIREACRQLIESTVWVLDKDQNPLIQREDIVVALAGMLESGEDFGNEIRVEKANSPAIFLVDEPEQHLHLLAQEEGASWLVDRSRENVSVIVATHSPTFLGLSPDDASLVSVRRNNGKTYLKNIGADLLAQVDELSSTSGLGRAGMLTLVRGVAIVEGLHDKLVMETFFSSELRGLRIVLIPLHGTDNASAMVRCELFAKSGLPLRVMFDRVRAENVGTGAPKKRLRKEELALKEVLKLRDAGGDVEPIAYDEPDVMCALPNAALMRAYPHAKFSQWSQIEKHWRSAGPINFKDFALREMGLEAVRATVFRWAEGDCFYFPPLGRAISIDCTATVDESIAEIFEIHRFPFDDFPGEYVLMDFAYERCVTDSEVGYRFMWGDEEAWVRGDHSVECFDFLDPSEKVDYRGVTTEELREAARRGR